jgi:hypothetical protein
MSKIKVILIASAIFALPLVSMAATAAEEAAAAAEKEVEVELGSYLCKDILRMSGDERSIALGLMHGYVLGKKSATSYMISELSKVTDDFIEFCLDNPGSKALESFEKAAK